MQIWIVLEFYPANQIGLYWQDVGSAKLEQNQERSLGAIAPVNDSYLTEPA